MPTREAVNSIGGFTGGGGGGGRGFKPPDVSSNPPEKFQPPQKIFQPPRLRGYSHEKEVLRVSQSINSTDFLQQQKLGLCPKLIIKLLIRFLKYGSNYCTST